jgi:hypothetical protein
MASLRRVGKGLSDGVPIAGATGRAIGTCCVALNLVKNPSDCWLMCSERDPRCSAWRWEGSHRESSVLERNCVYDDLGENWDVPPDRRLCRSHGNSKSPPQRGGSTGAKGAPSARRIQLSRYERNRIGAEGLIGGYKYVTFVTPQNVTGVTWVSLYI